MPSYPRISAESVKPWASIPPPSWLRDTQPAARNAGWSLALPAPDAGTDQHGINEALSPLENLMQITDDYPEVLAEMADLFKIRIRQQLPDGPVDSLALALVEDLRTYYGGVQIYIPIGDKFNRAQIHAAIRREFNGHNHSELARRYRMTASVIRRILKDHPVADHRPPSPPAGDSSTP
ncbi:MAG: hypothetical protein EKK71_15215 [Candidatus Competibacteraceae bacterium]|nr:MAG: hypothetical protein EKK71_15215 [Candidatus Competibacteraceae bacterium]